MQFWHNVQNSLQPTNGLSGLCYLTSSQQAQYVPTFFTNAPNLLKNVKYIPTDQLTNGPINRRTGLLEVFNISFVYLPTFL